MLPRSARDKRQENSSITLPGAVCAVQSSIDQPKNERTKQRRVQIIKNSILTKWILFMVLFISFDSPFLPPTSTPHFVSIFFFVFANSVVLFSRIQRSQVECGAGSVARIEMRSVGAWMNVKMCIYISPYGCRMVDARTCYVEVCVCIRTFFPSNSWVPCANTLSTLDGSPNVINPKPLQWENERKKRREKKTIGFILYGVIKIKSTKENAAHKNKINIQWKEKKKRNTAGEKRTNKKDFVIFWIVENGLEMNGESDRDRERRGGEEGKMGREGVRE